MRLARLWYVRVATTLAVWFGVVSATIFFGVAGNVIPVVVYSAITLLLIGIEVVRPGGSCASSGIGISPHSPTLFLWGASLAFGASLLIVLVSLLLGASLEWSTNHIPIMSMVFLVIQSAGEELFFRGTIFEALRERFSGNVAVGTMAVVFGLVHAFNPSASMFGVANVIFAGVMFGVMAIYSKSLWMPIGFHVTWNVLLRLFTGNVSGQTASFGVTSLDVSGIQPDLLWLIGADFGIEEGALTTVLLMAVIIVTIGYTKSDNVVRRARTYRNLRECA